MKGLEFFIIFPCSSLFISLSISTRRFITSCMWQAGAVNWASDVAGWPDLLRRALRLLLRGGGSQEAAEAWAFCACASGPHPQQWQCQPPGTEGLFTSSVMVTSHLASLSLHIQCFDNTNLWFYLYCIPVKSVIQWKVQSLTEPLTYHVFTIQVSNVLFILFVTLYFKQYRYQDSKSCKLRELVPVPELKQWKVFMHDSNQGLK